MGALPEAVGRGASTSFEVEAAAYLQSRLRLATGLLAVVVGAMWVIPHALFIVLHGTDGVLRQITYLFSVIHFVSWMILVGYHFRLRRGAPTMAELKAGDAVMLLVSVGTCLILALLSSWEGFPIVYAVLLLLIVTRAVVVPSTGKRTLLLSLPAVPGLIVVMLFRTSVRPSTSGMEEGHVLLVDLVVYGLILTLDVLVAAVASRVNFTLRMRVHEQSRLGPYDLEEQIGEGAMGSVYRATHALLKRPTAVKLLRPEISGQEAIGRFEREVKETSRLTHPNTISVYDYGHTPDGLFYYAMELLGGGDIEKVVAAGGPLPAARLIHALRQACGALHEAHELGLIHRDLKPGNIVLCERGLELDVVKVLDFGLVKRMGDLDPGLTQAGVFVGTPAFGAPELFLGAEATPASDLYSLGAVAWFAVTGKRLFEAEKVGGLVGHHLHTPPPNPADENPGVPADLAKVILACLAKKPEDRPQSAMALREELLACADAGGWSQEDARAWWASHRLE